MSKTITKEVYTFRELLELEKAGDVDSRVVEKVREKLQGWATDYEWWEFTYDTWKEALEQIGFTNPDISFSGFWSQGDGASFTSGIDIQCLIDFMMADIEPKNAIEPFPDQDGCTSPKEDFRPWILHNIKERGPLVGIQNVYLYRRLRTIESDYLSGRITRSRYSGNYVHERTCDTEIEFHDNGRVHRLCKVARAFEERVEDLRVDLCRAIYRDLEEEHDWRCKDEQLIEDCDANEWYFDLSGRIEW